MIFSKQFSFKNDQGAKNLKFEQSTFPKKLITQNLRKFKTKNYYFIHLSKTFI